MSDDTAAPAALFAPVPPAAGLFVRWECGCVGIRLPEAQAVPVRINPATEPCREVVINACDGGRDSDPYCIWLRPMQEKPWTPLPAKDVLALLKQLGDLVADGYRLREVKLLLS